MSYFRRELQPDIGLSELPITLRSSNRPVKFYKALKPILILGQIFALLPVSGLCSDDVNRLHIQIFSLKTLYAVLLQLLCILEFLIVFYMLLANGFDFNTFGNLMFYFIGIYSTFYLMIFAYKWKALMLLWSKHENIFAYPPYSNYSESVRFARKAFSTGYGFIVVFIADHFFRMSSELYKGYLRHKRCYGDQKDFGLTAKEIYIDQRSVLFKLIDFHYILIPIFEWVHISRRVAWSFAEVLIILIAMNLSLKFNQFYKRLNRTRQQIVCDSYWRLMREHYAMLCELVEKASDFSAPLLVLITFTDFFFLCERLYKQYAADYDTFGRVQISLLGLFFLLRSFTLFHYCSKVNVDASRPLEILREAPLRNWTIDFQRLVSEVENQNRGFSGLNFFLITKGFMISFVGTVTTYQLVILQNINSIRRSQNVTAVEC